MSENKESKKTELNSQDSKKEKKPRNNKKLKYGSLATAITIIFIAVVVLINVIVSAIGNNVNLKLDLTSDKIYEISSDTTDYLEKLKKDVDIACTYKESDMQSNEMYKIVYEILQKYKKDSNHIKLEYFDPTEDPDILQKYQSDYSGEITQGDVIVKSGKHVRVISMQDMFDVDQQKLQYYYYGQLSYRDCVTGFSGEQKLTSAIMYVSDSNPKKVAFLSKSNGTEIYNSNNENAYTLLKQLFDDNGYETSEIDIVTDDLKASDYDIAVLPAPQNDLSDDAISKISKFLENDGNYDKQLFYAADYTQSKTPNIDAFLEEWGMKVDSSIVEDTKNALAYGNYALPIATIADSTYSENLSNTSKPIATLLSRPIDILWDSNNERTTYKLLKTSDTSYRRPLSTINTSSEESSSESEDETVFDESTAEKGENIVMAACTRSQNVASAEDLKRSTVFVVGSMETIALAQSESLNNGEFIINAVNKACGKNDGAVIASKNLQRSEISPKTGQAQAVKIVVEFVIPIIILAIACVVFFRRRNK